MRKVYSVSSVCSRLRTQRSLNNSAGIKPTPKCSSMTLENNQLALGSTQSYVSNMQFDPKNPGASSLKIVTLFPFRLATLTFITDRINLSLETVRQALGVRRIYRLEPTLRGVSTELTWRVSVQSLASKLSSPLSCLSSRSLSLAKFFSVSAKGRVKGG